MAERLDDEIIALVGAHPGGIRGFDLFNQLVNGGFGPESVQNALQRALDKGTLVIGSGFILSLAPERQRAFA